VWSRSRCRSSGAAFGLALRQEAEFEVRHRSAAADVVEMEGRAQQIEERNPSSIPGPLQLEPYIRAVVLAAHPMSAEEEVTARVVARRERALLFEDQRAPEIWLVLHESLLWDPISAADAMADQLAHVAEVARRRR
jgi:hypothetical protein